MRVPPVDRFSLRPSSSPNHLARLGHPTLLIFHADSEPNAVVRDCSTSDAHISTGHDTFRGRAPSGAPSGACLRRLAEVLGVRRGDAVVFVPLAGARRRLRAPVSRIVESFVGTAAYADFDYLNSLIGEERSLNSIQAKVNPDPQIVRQFYRQLKVTPQLQGFSALREQKGQLQELLKIVNRFLIAFAGLLFCGGIVTSSLISLAERKQEIATFRVLGYQPRHIGGIFLRESVLVNSVGIALGLPLGYAFAFFINRFVATDLTRLPFVIDASTWIWTLVLGVAFTLIAYVPIYRAIRQLDWIAALNVNQ